MDDNFVWCALIFALAYIGRNMLPSYYELTNVRRHRLDNMQDDLLVLEERVDAINNAVDDNEQTMLDIHGRAIVEVRAVNYANSSNIVYRHSVQVRVDGGEWADIPVETVRGTDEEAAIYIIVNKPEEKTDD